MKKEMSYMLSLDSSEVGKCLLCHDPGCTKACPKHAPVGDILRSLYFENYLGALKKTGCDRLPRLSRALRESLRPAGSQSSDTDTGDIFCFKRRQIGPS